MDTVVAEAELLAQIPIEDPEGRRTGHDADNATAPDAVVNSENCCPSLYVVVCPELTTSKYL